MRTVPRVQEQTHWKASAVAMLLLLVFTSASFGMLLGAAVAKRVGEHWGIDPMFVAYVIAFLSLQGLALVWITRFLRDHGTTWAAGFGLRNAPMRSITVGALATVLALPVALVAIARLVSLVLKQFGIDAIPQPTVTFVQENNSVGQLVVLGFAAVVLAPIAEECLFRGVLFRALMQRGYNAVAWLGTSVLFAVIHGNLAAVLPLMFLATLFAWLYQKTGNLLAPITAHCLFNAVNFWALVAAPEWLQKYVSQ